MTKALRSPVEVESAPLGGGWITFLVSFTKPSKLPIAVISRPESDGFRCRMIRSGRCNLTSLLLVSPDVDEARLAWPDFSFEDKASDSMSSLMNLNPHSYTYKCDYIFQQSPPLLRGHDGLGFGVTLNPKPSILNIPFASSNLCRTFLKSQSCYSGDKKQHQQ